MVPQNPFTGLARQAGGQGKPESQMALIAKLLISIRNLSETYLRNVLNNTVWWEWKVLTNPGKKKKGALLQVGDESRTDHNKGAHFITVTAAEPP